MTDVYDGACFASGAFLEFDLDVSIRHASSNRHSLDDLLMELRPLAPVHRRFPASELIAQMDARLEAWREAGELRETLLASELIERHLPEIRADDQLAQWFEALVDWMKGL